MEFSFKYRRGNTYQLTFEPRGLCVSPFKKYSALVFLGQCISWCEMGNGQLDYSSVVGRKDIFHYQVVTNLDCWDLLQILEADHVHDDDILEMTYDLGNESE